MAVRAVGCHVTPVLDPELVPFTMPASAGPADLTFTIHVGRAPRLPSGPPLFSAGAWAMWSIPDGGFRVSLLRAREDERATIESDRTTSEVHYFEVEPYVRVVDGVAVAVDPFRLPVDQMLFVQHLAFREGVILHASGFVFGGTAVVFPGVSGAGKSTLTGLLAREFPDAIPLSDERIIVRASAGGFDAWGTPWTGTARVAESARAPLGALVFIRQHSTHGLAPLTRSETVRRLLAVAACPLYDPVRAPLVLRTFERLVEAVPAFELRFARDAGVGAVVRDLLQRELHAA